MEEPPPAANEAAAPVYDVATLEWLDDGFREWLDGEAAQGAELLTANCTPPPASKLSELTDAELLQLAAADEAMELTPKEKQELAKVRQQCAQIGRADGLSPFESAQRHAFKLVVHDGKRFAVCLSCKSCGDYQPTATGAQGRFLNNFWSRDLARHSKAVASGATPTSSTASAASATTTSSAASATSKGAAAPTLGANLAATTAAKLPAEQLDLLAALDDPELSDDQRTGATRLRQYIHERAIAGDDRFEGGVMLHIFRVIFAAGECMVECVCCGTRQSAQKGKYFLDHFQTRHLSDPRHAAAARVRHAAIHQTVLDTLRAAVGEAQAAAGRASMEGDAAHAACLASEAHEAAMRADAIAQRLAALERGASLLPRPLHAGEVEAQPIVATELEALVAANPALVWLENAAGERVGVCCNYCRRKRLEGTSDADVLRMVQEHITKNKEHLERSAHGGRDLLSFFGPFTKGPAPAPIAPPDVSVVCHGYHKSTLVLSRADGTTFAADVRFLLEREPTERAAWRPDRYFTSELRVGTASGAPRDLVVDGTLRSAHCRRLNTGVDGKPGLHGMCGPCRALAQDHAFKELVRKHHLALQRPIDASRTRFDLLSHTRRLEIMRSLAARVRLLRQQLFTLGVKYQYKCRRVRSLTERLSELTVRGDTKVLIDNIIACEKAGKFKARATLYNFIADLVRSLKLRADERGANSRANRWHESSMRVYATLKEMGGPKVIRFLHETLESPSESTVRGQLRRDKINYEPGVKRDHFAAIGEVQGRLPMLPSSNRPS